MDEGQTQLTPDVNNTPDVNTGSDSSTTQQTSTDQSPVTETLADGTPVDQKTVPYTVFKELKDEMRTMREELKSAPRGNDQPQGKVETPADPQQTAIKEQVKQSLKPILDELGYVSKDELLRQQQDQALNQTMTQLEKSYDGKDGRPKFERKQVVDFAIANHIGNPEVAYKVMHEAALLDWHVKQAVTKGRGIQTEASNGSGSGQVGTSNDDLKAAIAKGDRNALHTLLKRSIAPK